jgi:ABC-2 type transport system permease protein
LVACVGGVVVLAVGSGVYAMVLAADPAISADIFESVVRAAAAYVPSVVALAALTALLVAALPSWTALIWACYGFGLLSGWFGGLLGLPEWTRFLSPLSAVDAASLGLSGWADFAWGNVAAITAVAAVALALAHIRFRARDLVG